VIDCEGLREKKPDVITAWAGDGGCTETDRRVRPVAKNL